MAVEATVEAEGETTPRPKKVTKEVAAIDKDGKRVGKIKTLADGTKVQENDNGVKIEIQPDGHRIQTNVDGVVIETRGDGTTIQRNPCGVVIRTNADGSSIQRNTDGTIIETSTDGSRIQTNPDGSKIQADSTGKIVVADDEKKAAGDVLSDVVEPDTPETVQGLEWRSYSDQFLTGWVSGAAEVRLTLKNDSPKAALFVLAQDRYSIKGSATDDQSSPFGLSIVMEASPGKAPTQFVVVNPRLTSDVFVSYDAHITYITALTQTKDGRLWEPKFNTKIRGSDIASVTLLAQYI